MHKVQTKGINSLRAPSRVLAIVSTLSHPSQKWGFVICHPCAKDSNAEAGPGLIQQDPCWDWDLFGIPKQSWECRKSLLQLPHAAFPPGIASAAQIAAGLLPWEVSGVMMGAKVGQELWIPLLSQEAEPGSFTPGPHLPLALICTIPHIPGDFSGDFYFQRAFGARIQISHQLPNELQPALSPF